MHIKDFVQSQVVVIILVAQLNAPFCPSRNIGLGRALCIQVTVFGKRAAQVVISAPGGPAGRINVAAKAALQIHGSAVFLPGPAQIHGTGRHSLFSLELTIFENKAVIQVFPGRKSRRMDNIFGSGNIISSLQALDDALIIISGTTCTNKVGAAFNQAIIIKGTSALFEVLGILKTFKPAIFERLAIAHMVNGYRLGRSIGVLHRYVLHIEIGSIDGHGRRLRCSGYCRCAVAVIINFFAVVIVPAYDYAVAMLAHDTDYFVQGNGMRTDVHFFLVKAFFYVNQTAFIPFGQGINGGRQSLEVTGTIFGHNNIVITVVVGIERNLFAHQTIYICFQYSITTAEFKVAILRIERIQSVFQFPKIVHAVLIHVDDGIVGMVFRVTAHVRRPVDDAFAGSHGLPSVISDSFAYLIHNPAVYRIARKGPCPGQHTLVSLLGCFRSHGIGYVEGGSRNNG